MWNINHYGDMPIMGPWASSLALPGTLRPLTWLDGMTLWKADFWGSHVGGGKSHSFAGEKKKRNVDQAVNMDQVEDWTPAS